MTEGRIKPAKEFLKFRLVMVTKLVMTTSSLGIIIMERKITNISCFPLNSSLAKAKAAKMTTASISMVVITVKTRVLLKYFPRDTVVKACT